MSEIFNTSSIFSGPTTPTKPRALLGLSPTKKDGTAPAQSTRLTTPVKPKLIGGIYLSPTLVLATAHVRKVSGSWSWLHSYEYARYLYAGLPESQIRWNDLDLKIEKLDKGEHLKKLLLYLKNLSIELEIGKVEEPKSSLWNQIPLCESQEEINAAFLLGKIHFTGDLKIEDKRIVLRLNPACVGTSSRMYRKFGSDRFFRLRLSDDVERAGAPLSPNDPLAKSHLQNLNHFVQNSEPVLLFGRRYRPFCVKDKAILYWCEGGPNLDEIPLWKFLELHLESELNKEMKVAKYVSRLELGLTTTTSTVEFSRNQVIRVPDLLSDSLMISHAMMSNIYELIESDGPPGYVPSAIRGHYFENKKKVPMVWRLDYNSIDSPSQYEIQIRQFISNNPKHLICHFEVLKKSGGSGNVFIKISNIDWVVEKPVTFGIVMTDGCSLISPVAMRRIRNCLAHEIGEEKAGIGLPAAAQGRVGPAKGVWAVASDTYWSREKVLDDSVEKQNDRCWIEVRDSQWKYNDRQTATFAFEVHSIPSPKSSANLGKQLFEVLGDNGVSTDIIKRMLKDQLDLAVTYFANWDNLVLLLRQIETQTSLFSDREMKAKINLDPSMLRATTSTDEVKFDDAVYVQNGQLDPLSGAPNTITEVVVSMLQAGFSPKNCAPLAHKIIRVAEDHIKSNIHFNIESTTARTALVVADHLGRLKEGELFYQPSKRIIDAEGRASGVIDGPVLISRPPTIQACDVQRYNAVYIPEFRHIFDLIILPSVGERPACSVLSGGDYDGDKLLILTDPILVESFNPAAASPSFADPPFQDDEYFEVDRRTVSTSIIPLIEARNDSALAQELTSSFFTGNYYGLLSKMHTKLAYMYGLHATATSTVGHLYAKALDGRKQGYTISDENWERIQKTFEGRSPNPAWTLQEEDLDKNIERIMTATRTKELGPHVMDILVHVGSRALARGKRFFADKIKSMTYEIDPDCSGFWQESWEIGLLQFNEEGSSLFFEDLNYLLRHIKTVYEQYKTMRLRWKQAKDVALVTAKCLEAPGSPSKSPLKKWQASSATHKEDLVNLTRQFWSPLIGAHIFKSRELLGVGGTVTVRALLASCAYLEPLQPTNPPSSYVQPATAGNLFRPPLGAQSSFTRITRNSSSRSLARMLGTFSPPTSTATESSAIDPSPVKRMEGTVNPFIAEMTMTDQLDIPPCTFVLSSSPARLSMTSPAPISTTSSPTSTRVAPKIMEYSKVSGKDYFVFDFAHQDILGLKADAKAKTMYGGSSIAMGGTQARKVAPEMLHAMSIAKRSAGVEELTKKTRPITLLPPPSSGSSGPSPSKKVRIS